MTSYRESRGDDSENSRIIRHELHRICDEAYVQYPILKHQDTLGFLCLFGSCAAIVSAVLAYAHHMLPAWLTVVTIAFFMSILHELEHDLIHRLYFKTRPWLYHTGMFLVWLFRPSTINPWVRRDWHLHHHRASGTESDIEERVLTNGERWGVRRLLMSMDVGLSMALRPTTIRRMQYAYADAQRPADDATKERIVWRNRRALVPFSVLFVASCYLWAGLHASHGLHTAFDMTWQASPFATKLLSVLDFMAITVFLPCALRTSCLHFVSSNIHYFGDIDSKIIVQQTQCWTSPLVWPLQAFCFNFGSTHAIHHFAVQYPFYLRQLVAADAHRVMRAYGVRFNDFASMRYANRWNVPSTSPVQTSDAEAA
jgi:fatty acid desaturase